MLLNSISDLQALIDETRFARKFRFRVRAAAEGSCVVDWDFDPDFGRPGGIVSGEVPMTMADLTFWLAIKTTAPIEDMSVTSELNTAFLSPARDHGLSCEARVLKQGRRLVYGVAECRSPAGKLVTHHTLTYARPA